ncbi:MAG: hypothetical protein Q4B89_02640 [Lachnospiraceae bacterium]|nr:hypothetical protein [Lachnospiraceae bacterium]
MKNREYKTLVAIATASALLVGSLGVVSPSLAQDDKTTMTQTVENTDQKEISTKNITNAKPFKSETVYAKIDGNGNVSSVTVSDQLKNIDNMGQLKDTSILKNIENVKGEEKFSQKQSSLLWDTDNKDICYQGTTEEPLPVGIKVTYTLDGKEITAKELKGKSGHLVMRYQYTNETASESEYVPFAMVTGLIFDTDKISNVTLTNAKMISDGDRDVILGMGIPALKEQFDVKELDIPDYFEVEADVKDYELSEGMTIATNDIFNDLETDKFDSLSELKNSMKTLQDSANKLVDGSGELRKGLDTLLSSSGTLTDGIHQLVNGGSTLKKGTSSLASGSKSLVSGSQSLANGTAQLQAGTNSLQKGASQVNAGLSSASSKTSSVLLPGAVQLDNGVTDMQNKLTPGMQSLAQGVQQLDAGLNSPLTAAQPGLKVSVSAVNDVMNKGTAETGGKSLSKIAKDTATAADALAKSMQSPTNTTSAETVAKGNGETDKAIASLNELLKREDLPEDAKASIQASISSLEKDKQARQTSAAKLDKQIQSLAGTQELLKQVVIGTKTTSAVVDKVAGNMTKINAGTTQLAQGAKELDTKVTDSKSGLIAQVNGGVSALKNGTSQLREGIGGKNGLADGLNQLASGASQVNSGASTLNEKMAVANSGAKELHKGASQLSAGASQLDSGAGTLVSGLNTLNKGSSALIDGVKKLDAGAVALNDGMIKFNKEGIEKLVSVFDGDIDGLLDKVNTILDSSKNYKNFSGISEDMDGEVKFIFVTE